MAHIGLLHSYSPSLFFIVGVGHVIIANNSTMQVKGILQNPIHTLRQSPVCTKLLPGFFFLFVPDLSSEFQICNASGEICGKSARNIRITVQSGIPSLFSVREPE